MVVLVAGIAVTAPGARSEETAAAPFVAATSSRAFGDSVGVTVRFSWNGTA